MKLSLAATQSAVAVPAPFSKGGYSGQPLVARIGTMNHGMVS